MKIFTVDFHISVKIGGTLEIILRVFILWTLPKNPIFFAIAKFRYQ